MNSLHELGNLGSKRNMKRNITHAQGQKFVFRSKDIFRCSPVSPSCLKVYGISDTLRMYLSPLYQNFLRHPFRGSPSFVYCIYHVGESEAIKNSTHALA